MPAHKGKSMRLTEQVVKYSESESDSFDFWLSLTAIASDKSVKLMIPIKRHKHFTKLQKKGRLQKSYTISKDCVQFAFEIDTGNKKKGKNAIGVDTGINALASLSTGEQFGRTSKSASNESNDANWEATGNKRRLGH